MFYDYFCAYALIIPDIIEILSPSKAARDLDLKFKLYEENEVKEYWIVKPSEEMVSVFDLIDGKYNLRDNYNKSDTVNVKTIGLLIDVKEIF